MCERAGRVDNRLNAAARPYAPAFEVAVGDVIHFAGARSGRALEGLILCDQQLQSLCNKENLRSAPEDNLDGRGARWKNSQRGQQAAEKDGTSEGPSFIAAFFDGFLPSPPDKLRLPIETL